MQAGEWLARHSPYSAFDPDLKTKQNRPSGPLGGAAQSCWECGKGSGIWGSLAVLSVHRHETRLPPVTATDVTLSRIH
jgi:hypothetical protein